MLKQVAVVLGILLIVLTKGQAADENKSGEPDFELLLQIKDECLQENSITDDDLANIDAFDESVNEAVKCTMKCYYTKMGVLQEDGTVIMDKINQLLEEDFAEDEEQKPIVNDCLKDMVVNDCNSIINFQNCFSTLVNLKHLH